MAFANIIRLNAYKSSLNKMKIIFNKCILIIFNFLIIVKSVNSAKILCYFPIAYRSHQTVFRLVTERLADLGHELIVITPIPHDSPYKNIQDIDIREFTEPWNKHVKIVTDELFPKGPPIDNLLLFKHLYRMMSLIAGKVFELTIPLLDYKSDYFDLIIIETCFLSAVGWAAKFDAPVISLSTSSAFDTVFDYVGTLTHPLLYHDWLENNIVQNTFIEKIYHIYEKLAMKHYYNVLKDLDTAVIRKHFGEDSKSIDELQQGMDLLILNGHPIWDGLRPQSPLQIYAPAYNFKPNEALPKDLQEYLDSLNNDVIYMSFGSGMNVANLPAETIEIIFKVFEAIPYNIILQWNGDAPTNSPKNVRFEKWVPQSDLLYHPKVKLLVTHCGLHSIDEAVAAKVPMIGIPLGWDHIYNAQKMEQFGLGIKLQLNNLNYMEFREAIMNVAANYSIYHQKIINYSHRIEAFQEGSLEKVIYWVEYVLRHGTDHMKSPYAKTSIVEYFLLDVLAVLISFILLSLILIIFLLKTLHRKCFGKRSSTKNHFL